MSMQQVIGVTIFAVKNWIKVLQQITKKNELSIQDARDAYWRKRTGAATHRMTTAEYLILNPVPVTDASFVTENIEIAAKKISYAAAGANDAVSWPLRQRFEFLERYKQYSIEKYNLNVAQPERGLTKTEFLQLYPVPVDADFAVPLAAIATATSELTLLLKFMQSGPVQTHIDVPGLYDTAFLTGTAIIYP